MEVLQILHMNKGDGKNSYAKNSLVQSKIISTGKRMMEEAVEKMVCSIMIPEVMEIADLGCSSGPNTLIVISEIMNVIHSSCRNQGRPSPELRVSLNDLPTNDFNYIFASLPSFYKEFEMETKGSCFVSGVAGSFYGRLFPRNCMHFVHSSSSLHWLSQVPADLESNGVNKGKIYISKSSPKCVLEAYCSQFRKDFSRFLKARSEELVHGGRMVLSFMGRRYSDPTTEESCYQWELLAQALMSMAKEGIIEEEKIDSFNAPYYAPSVEEVRIEVRKEGSFDIDRVEAFEVDWDGGSKGKEEWVGGGGGERVASTVRAVVESMLESQFGGGDIMDELFKRYAQIVGHYLSKNSTKYINLLISLVRNHI